MTHIADDPEILESYVVGRMEEKNRSAWDDHIAHCTPCREAVDRETLLIAGIRRVGRDDVKNRINSLVRRSREDHSVPWPRIWSIAASLLLIIGIGIVSRWMILRNESVAVPPPARQDVVPHGEQHNAKAPAQREELRNTAPPPVQPSPSRSATAVVQQEVDAVPSPVEKRMDEAERVTGEAANAPSALADLNVAAQKIDNEARSEKAKAAKLGAIEKMNLAMLSKDSDSVRVLLLPSADSLTPGGTTINLNQQPATLIRREPAGIVITLFFPPTDTDALRTTPRFQRVSSDSGIVIVGERRFGIRLPAKD